MRGLHLIADLHDCACGAPLADLAALRTLCLRAVADCGLHAVGELFHPFVDADGRAQGVTGVVLLAESHVAIHTWPELDAVTADVYVCNLGGDNSARAERLLVAIVDSFGAKERTIQHVQRGSAPA